MSVDDSGFIRGPDYPEELLLFVAIDGLRAKKMGMEYCDFS
jgi:hypothetical protein